MQCLEATKFAKPWWRGLVVPSPPATEETGAQGREIESRQCVGRMVDFKKLVNEMSYNFDSNPRLTDSNFPYT
jgi:hypothetical protein